MQSEEIFRGVAKEDFKVKSSVPLPAYLLYQGNHLGQILFKYISGA